MNAAKPLLGTVLTAVLALSTHAAAQQPEGPGCRLIRQGDTVEIHSPFFVYRLSIAKGLRAESWDNRLTGSTLPLGGGAELEVDIGLPGGPISTVQWLPSATRIKSGAPGKAVLELASENPKLSATVTYTWDADQPVLRKSAVIRNDSDRDLDRLLNCRLGDYTTRADAPAVAGTGRGFPAYIDGQYFLTLAHPAGFAEIVDGRLMLRQYPGTRLAPGQTFSCMEAVYGVAGPQSARSAFVRHVRSRMRRVLRGHDKPYALLESFGGQPSGDFWTTEQYLLDHLGKVARGLREGGPKFDFYCTEFWHDPAGDLTRAHPKNFPNGFNKVRDEILRLGMRPGLWIDSGGLPAWTIGENPAIRGCFTKGEGKGEICRATEPINSMYKKAFIHHVRENKVGLLKFDNLGPGCQFPCCDNPSHSHLPGPLYSVEAIHNAAIDFLRELDSACPDVFIMLYWGYRSPWWLEYGDTYFECGQHIEAASPTEFPAAYGRDSVTQRLDQAQTLITDTPWLGKDSLGIWLSDWPWNSCVGKAHWQEGLIMDLGRGSLLAQIWTDTNWLTPPERKQLADFIALLKANPDCFDNSRPILGSPHKSGAYGYACSNGKRGFLAIHNAGLEDQLVTLQLGPAWGLPDKAKWDLYRWYPEPARLTPSRGSFGGQSEIALRPYEVVLLEVAPSGEPPSLDRGFEALPIPAAFAERSGRLDVKASWVNRPPDVSPQWQAITPTAAAADQAVLKIQEDGSILASGPNVQGDVFTITASTDGRALTAVMLETLTDESLPSRGPGRAENGNFALTNFRLFAAPKDKPQEATEVKFQTARADFSQTTHGGWPVTAAIDNDVASGWSVYPKLGIPHVAIFEAATPVNLSTATTLTFKLTQGQNGHSLGRFRISMSSVPSPALPADYRPGQIAAELQLPASRSGGIVLLIGEHGMGTPTATLAGREVRFEPVWSDKAYYVCAWQAWRADIAPDQSPQLLHALVETQRSSALPKVTAHFLPR